MFLFPHQTQVVLLIMAVIFLGGHFLLENPLSSLDTCHLIKLLKLDISVLSMYILRVSTKIVRHERLAELLNAWQMPEIYTSLGMFGAQSPKPTKLISDDGWISHLHRTGSFQHLIYIIEMFSYMNPACHHATPIGDFSEQVGKHYFDVWASRVW